MKNPFFNLPDFGGELLDLRLALRLIVRQAFKPMHGHPTPRHAVMPVIKPAFVPALKATLRSNFRFITQTASRFQQMFPSMLTSARPVAATSVAGNSALGKSASGKHLAGKSLAKRPVAGKSLSAKHVSGKSPMGKSVHKGAAHSGKRVVTSGNAAPTPRLVHPATAQPEKVREGMWVEYNKHAVVIARGNYANNETTGLWREYYDSGELMIEEHFTRGVQHGRFATFHPNGQCCSDGMYEEGRREGRFFMYDENGRNVRTLTFKRDVLVEDVIVEEQLAMA